MLKWLAPGSVRSKSLETSEAKSEFQELSEQMRILDGYCGVGLWQMIFHNGDPTDPASKWIFSTLFRSLLGFKTEAEFPNTMKAWADRLHPDDMQTATAALAAHLQDRTGRTPYDDHYRLKAADGTYRWFRAAGGCLRDANGLALRAGGSLSDIHEQKMSELRQREAAERQAQVVTTLGQALTRLARGDLSARVEIAFSPEFQKLKDDFNSATEALQQAMQAVASVIDGVQASAGEIADASNNLSRRTEQQAASIEETAATLDEITTTVKRTAEGARQASETVASAKDEAERSGLVVNKAVEAIGEIEKSSRSVTQIIGVIDEIAFQTNLLALNAGVEAARAGEAGRGFAVVASEVRALAQRSAEAAKEIKGLISQSTELVEGGVRLVGQTGEALQSIVRKVAAINTAISEIATGAQEQAASLGEINVAINQMDQAVQQNAAMVEETTASAAALNTETTELVQLIGHFETGTKAGKPMARRTEARQAHEKPLAVTPVEKRNKATAVGGSMRRARQGNTVLQESWEEF